MKRGFTTSEFWVTIITQIVGLIVLSGRLSPEYGDLIQQSIIAVLKTMIDFVTAIYMLYTAVHYIQSRTELKKQLIIKSP